MPEPLKSNHACVTVKPYFINTARGPLVDQDALTDALKSGRLDGAALETFAVEPTPADLELLKLENVTLTPHIAGASRKTIVTAAEAAAEEIRRYLEGEGALNPCVGGRMDCLYFSAEHRVVASLSRCVSSSQRDRCDACGCLCPVASRSGSCRIGIGL